MPGYSVDNGACLIMTTLAKVNPKPRNHRLTRDDVKYLSLEGGGGKGFAFVGALQALEHEKIGLLKTAATGGYTPTWAPSYFQGIDPTRHLVGKIKGVSGSSAGAIMALLVSCGYNSDDILKIMTQFNFDKLMEPPRPRYVPRIEVDPTSNDPYGREQKDLAPVDLFRKISSTFWELLMEGVKKAIVPPIIFLFLAPPNKDSANIMNQVVKDLAAELKLATELINEYLVVILLGRLIRLLILFPKISSKVPGHLKRLLKMHLEIYLAFLREDMGFLPGYEARKFFAEVLAYKMPLRNGKPWYNATFQDHWNFFHNKLVVTGANLETKKSGIFSTDTTPHFPVADAVRISMSLPILYKPVVIREQHYATRHSMSGYLPEWVNGVWVDGGYLNNIPLHVFDLEEGDNPKTLGLRLDIADEQRKQIETFFDFFPSRYPLEFGFGGAGEAHISEANKNLLNTILLNTEGLSLTEFKPDPTKRDAAINRAFHTTLEYFGIRQ